MTVMESDVTAVADIMTGDLLTLRPIDTVALARDILSTSGLHAIPIIEGGEAMGMVTLADCEGQAPDELLRNIVTGPPVSIDADASVKEAASLMRDEHLHHLLVNEPGSDKTVGILSSFDLLYLLAGDPN